MQTVSLREGQGQRYASSRISNGTALVSGADGRTSYVRRYRDLVLLHSEDLGGDEGLTEAQRSMVRRIAVLTIELEKMETGFAVELDRSAQTLDLYNRTAGNLRRCLEAIGIGG
jgi:hypothetical protein